MIDTAIRTRLLSVAAVTTLVGDGDAARVWPVVLPQRAAPKWPAITYQMISGRPDYELAAVAGVALIRIQINCWSGVRPEHDAYAEARALAEAVRGALSGFSGTIGSDVIQTCFLENRISQYDDETQTHWEMLDFVVGYTEA